MEGNHLISTDNWFYGPDGKQYKAAWGEVTILNDSEIMGIKTNLRSSNWFARVGSKDNHVIIAGCQIHYAIKMQDKPPTNPIQDYTVEAGVIIYYNRPSAILVMDGVMVPDIPKEDLSKGSFLKKLKVPEPIVNKSQQYYFMQYNDRVEDNEIREFCDNINNNTNEQRPCSCSLNTGCCKDSEGGMIRSYTHDNKEVSMLRNLGASMGQLSGLEPLGTYLLYELTEYRGEKHE